MPIPSIFQSIEQNWYVLCKRLRVAGTGLFAT